jgi:hypothetical protein
MVLIGISIDRAYPPPTLMLFAPDTGIAAPAEAESRKSFESAALGVSTSVSTREKQKVRNDMITSEIL